MIYDPLTSAEASKTNNVMLNGHTDFNSISTLVSQPVTALQILLPDGHWRYVRVSGLFERNLIHPCNRFCLHCYSTERVR